MSRKIIYFEDLTIGVPLWGDEIFADPEEMMGYNRRNDPWPIHVDPEFAATTPFGGVIASGGFTITLLYRSLNGVYNNERQVWQFLGGLNWELKFAAPVRAGDRLRSCITIKSKRLSSKPGRGVLNKVSEFFNQDGTLVLSINVVSFVATKPLEANPQVAV
jgi:acyl dehydratase